MMEKYKKAHSTTLLRFWQWAIFVLLVTFVQPGLADNKVAEPAIKVPNSDPDFEEGMSNNVRVAVGTTAYLTCRPRSLRNKTVSWIRHRDLHILTSGRFTYTNDQRFSVYHQRHTGEWTLQLQFAQPRDSGLYECQIGTQPTRSFFVNLQVVEPTTTIFGGPEMHVHEGSPLNISCVVHNSVGQPEFFFWKHNGNGIKFGQDRYEMRQHFAGNDETVSSFVIKSAQFSDSGNYTCMPAYCPPVSAKVYILKGEEPAAMQRSSAAGLLPFTAPLTLLVTDLVAYSAAYFFNLLQLPVLYVPYQG